MIDLAWLKQRLYWVHPILEERHSCEVLSKSDAHEMMTEIEELRAELFRAQYPQSEGLGPQHQE